jgi:hypothetical protein
MTMKSGIADTEKISIARQRHGEYVSAVMNNHATAEGSFEVMFSTRSVQRLCKENRLEFKSE